MTTTTTITTKGRVAVIGAGVSGLGAASVWKRCGYEAVVYEAAGQPGGQWLEAYDGVRLQNTLEQYHFPSFPWPVRPDRHPTKAQILEYLRLAITEFELDVRYHHRVANIRRSSTDVEHNATQHQGCSSSRNNHWELTVRNEGSNEVRNESFSYVVIATGQYPWGEAKFQPSFPDRELYKGTVLTNIDSAKDFYHKKVAVVDRAGSGNLGLEPHGNVGVHTRLPNPSLDGSRLHPGDVLQQRLVRPMPSWCHSSGATRFLHSHMSFLVDLFWTVLIASVLALQHTLDAGIYSGLSRDERRAARERLGWVLPPKSQLVKDFRSATALCPKDYMPSVASGRLTVKRAEVQAFVPHGLKLSTGETIEADVVVLCCGNQAPTYSTFFDPASPEAAILRDSEQRPGGLALYRHVVHPLIPNLGFAGNNHSFLHTALVEVGALWTVAAFEGYLELPSETEQIASADRVARYKQEHCTFESTSNMAVSTRFQQYLDILCRDLGISPWRKLPNPVAEYFHRYGATDYATCVPEYLKLRETNKGATHRVVFEADA